MLNNRTRTIVLSLIFCFICSSFIVSNSYCSEDNPYCSGDQEKIEELTDEFIQKYGDEVKFRWSEDTGIPRRIYSIYCDESEVDIDDPKEIALSFLSENSLFFGMNINDIKFRKLRDTSTGYRVDFDTFYKEVPVEGQRVDVLIRESDDGRIRLSLLSDYLPCLDLDVDPAITSAEAANIVKKDLGVSRLITVDLYSNSYSYAELNNPYNSYQYNPYGYSPYGNIYSSPYSPPTLPSTVSPLQWKAESVEPELIIFPKNGGDIYLAWKIICVEEPFGTISPGHYYFIDAHTGEIIHHTQPAYGMTTSSGDETSSNNTTYNNIYNPANIPNSRPYNPPYSPPYNAPYSTSYTPYNSPIGGDWFSGNYFNLMSNYNVFSNNNFFSPSGNIFQPTLSSSIRGLESYGNFINGGNYNPFLGGSNYFPLGNSFPFMSNPFYGFPY